MAMKVPREVVLFAFFAAQFLISELHAIEAFQPLADANVVSGSPPPIVRGVALAEGQYARVYLEDPRTGMVTEYALGDTVDDSRIEEIKENLVVLRRGDELIQLVFGGPSAAATNDSRAAVPPQRPRAPAITSEPRAPIIGNGQPWLDQMGIPQGALSQAIESAVPDKEADAPDD